jgi:hypothetical protein
VAETTQSEMFFRNPAARSARLERHDVAELRARILGIGCEGLITKSLRDRHLIDICHVTHYIA